MKKKVLVVLTGGTICSTIKENVRTLDVDSARITLVSGFLNSDSPLRDEIDFEIGENFNTLSENMTIEKWNQILDYFRGVKFELYDGVIVAHGTDTLAYISSLMAILLNGIGIPFFLVSSNAPLELGDKKANGYINFKCAVECIGYGIKSGVYVPYRNIEDQKLYLHLGSRLSQSRNYSEDFYSVGAMVIEELDKDVVTQINSNFSLNFYEGESFLYKNHNHELHDCVLRIDPYVGINYEAYNYNKYKVVLHSSYHSGTACVEKTATNSEYSNHSILYLLDRCSEIGVDVYVSPVKSEGDIYDTVPIMLRHEKCGKHIIPLYGCTIEMAYVKLLIVYSYELQGDEFTEIMYNNCFGECFAE